MEKKNKKKRIFSHHDQLEKEKWKLFRKARKSLISEEREPELVVKIEEQLKKHNKKL